MRNFFHLFKRALNIWSQDSKPGISPSMVEHVLQEPYKNIVLYDCIHGKINRMRYNGHPVVGQKQIVHYMSDFNSFCAGNPAFTDRVPVAIVAKTYKFAYPYTYFAFGASVAGNIIFYSPTTGKYSALPHGWFAAGRYFCHVDAAEEALLKTVNYILDNRERIVQLTQQHTK